jgi:hypothetical protein
MCFCYDDWNGPQELFLAEQMAFGGSPATVGANKDFLAAMIERITCPY